MAAITLIEALTQAMAYEMREDTSVLVLGHGEMGRAMDVLLAPRVSLAIWDKFPQPGFNSAVLAAAAPRADVVIFCLPTVPHAGVLQELLPLLEEAERVMLADHPLLPIYFYVNKHLVKPYVRGWTDNVMNVQYSKDLWLERGA